MDILNILIIIINNLLAHDKKLLKKYNEIWDIVKNHFKRGFDSKPVYNNKYIKTRIKVYNDRISTNFQYKEITKDNKFCACLSVILLDSIVVNEDKKCYPQIFLEECKYAVKKKKIMNTINEELNLDESDDESDDEQNCANRDKCVYEQ